MTFYSKEAMYSCRDNLENYKLALVYPIFDASCKTTKHELYDLVGIFSGIFSIFWYPSEQILGPGG